jgi:hypothetical protein
VFEYLWDDVAKYHRNKCFNDLITLNDLIDKYVEKGSDESSGVEVFNKGIFDKK